MLLYDNSEDAWNSYVFTGTINDSWLTKSERAYWLSYYIRCNVWLFASLQCSKQEPIARHVACLQLVIASFERSENGKSCRHDIVEDLGRVSLPSHFPYPLTLSLVSDLPPVQFSETNHTLATRRVQNTYLVYVRAFSQKGREKIAASADTRS